MDGIDAFWTQKQNHPKPVPPEYVDIELPKNTACGFIIGVLGGMLAFGLVWHIWWLAILTLLGMVGSAIARAFQSEGDYTIPAASVAKMEAARGRA